MDEPATPRGGDRGDHGRRDRWRAQPRARTTAASRAPARIGWTIASLAGLAAIAGLAVLPLFSRRTAVIQLSIDEYDLGVLAPVPFGPEDVAAVEQTLAGRFSSRIDPAGGPLTLDGRYHTAKALRGELGALVAGLPLRGRDTLVAIVRGQTVVTADAGSSRRAHLLAEDVKLGPTGPSDGVGCRDLFTTFAASPARTTLVIFDMGDLRWDVRLGVAGGVVPAQLDEETRQPPPANAGECWILGSHDLHEFSGVSLEDRRGVFLRAVELALDGRADDRAWGGDGDGEVELHELVGFVSEWTERWSRRETGNEFAQHPVAWKLGEGRVAPEMIPRDIRVVRAGPPRKAPIAFMQGDPAVAEPNTAPASGRSPAQEEPAVVSSATPPSPLPGTVDQDLWYFVDQLSDRDATRAATAPLPIDFAPHLWRETVALAAAVSGAPHGSSPAGERARSIERKLRVGLERYLERHDSDVRSNVPEGDDDGTPLARLNTARREADGGAVLAWRNGDAVLREAVAIRNRAADFTMAAIEWFGVSAGSSLARPLSRALPRILADLGDVNEELRTLMETGSAVASTERLAEKANRLKKRYDELQSLVATACDTLLERIRRGGPLPAADIRWLRDSRLPTAERRQRLADAVAERLPPTTAMADTAPAVAGGEPAQNASPDAVSPTPEDATSVPDRRLELPSNPSARTTPAARPAGGRSTGPETDHFQESVKYLALLATLFDPDGAGRLGATAPGGEDFAATLARIPQEVDALLRASRGPAILGDSRRDPRFVIDGLLRLCDSRDARRVQAGALGWVPSVRVAPPLRLAISADAERLEFGRSQRVLVALQSGAPLPADGRITIDFDGRRLRVRRLGGSDIQPGRPFPVSELTDRDRLVLLVEPLLRLAAGRDDRGVTVSASLNVATRGENQSRRFLMPLAERLSVAMRGRAGTVDGGIEGPDRWRTVAIDALSGPADNAVAQDGRREAIGLRPFPGRMTAWEIEIANQTGERRAVEAEILSVGPPANDGNGAESRWTQLRNALMTGRPLPAGVHIVASCGPLELLEGTERLRLSFVPPRAPPAAGGAGVAPEAAAPESLPLASTLALVVRDVAAPPVDTAAAGTPPPVSRPPDRRRIWLLELPLSMRPPLRYLEPRAIWSEAQRSITVEVKPAGGNVSLLPQGNVRVRMEPWALTPDSTAPGLAARKVEAVVAVGQPADQLRAEWRGDPDKPAEFALAVDGYPRAFVFRVECRPAMDGKPQAPQPDVRGVRFLQPAEPFQAFKSPVDTIPLVVAVDGPPDAFPEGSVELHLREDRDRPEVAAADDGRSIWIARGDRQVAYASGFDGSPGPLAVSTTVRDWHVDLPTAGFNDVDATLEARLRLPNDTRIARTIVVFDGSPPHVDDLPRVDVAKGQPKRVVVLCQDGEGVVGNQGRRPGAGGVVKVEWRIDVDRDGAAEMWQAVKTDANGQATVTIPTDDLQIGRHTVVVRAVDAVGWTATPVRFDLDVVEPKPDP